MNLRSVRFFGRLCTALLIAGAAQAQAQPTSPPTDNLALWLSADQGVTTGAEGAVVQWADQSGNLNDAYGFEDGTAPVLIEEAINGQPAIQFDGVDDFLDVYHAPVLENLAEISSFFVVKFDDFATFRAVWAKTAGNLPSPTDYYLLPGSGLPRVIRGDGAANMRTIDGLRSPGAGEYAILGFEQRETEPGSFEYVMTQFLNGQPNGSGAINNIFLFDDGGPLKIGTRADGATRLKGELAEVLIYNAALTQEDLEQVNAYLAAKYGLENEPPAVAITFPPNNTTLEAPVTGAVTVEASDADGTIAQVQLLVNGRVIATASQPPYTFPITAETPATLTVTAIATDNRGASTTSAPITVNIVADEPAPMPELTSLKLWLRGDEGVVTDESGYVTEWQDQSGNENHALQIDPFTYSPTVGEVAGQPAVRFDASRPDYLDIEGSEDLAITGDIASFFVVRVENFESWRSVWGQTMDNVPRPNDYYLQPNSGQPILYRGAGETTAGPNQAVSAAGGAPMNTPVLLGFQQAGATVTHYLNGAPFGSGQITLTPESYGHPLRIGSRGDLVTRMHGDIAELLIFDAALSAEELAGVRRYLGAKYGLALLYLQNTPPTVQVTAPSSGSIYQVPETVTITATAEDADGSIASVTFLVNNQAIGTATSAPYSITLELDAAAELQITARATDNLGGTTTSAPINITAQTAQQLPIPAANLQLWLRADEGLTVEDGWVTAWQDSSGRNNNAAQSDLTFAPFLEEDSINGQPALWFDGVDDYLIVEHAPSLVALGDISSFFVARFTDFAGYRAIWGKTGGAGGNEPRPTDFYTLPDTGIPRVFRGGSGGNALVDGLSPLPPGEFAIVGYQQADTTLTHYLNGVQNGSGTINVTEEDTGTNLLIGTRGDQFTRMFGEIAEIIIYDRALSPSELNQLHGYLGEKYGIIEPPAAEPEITVTRGDNNTITLAWPIAAGDFQVMAADELGTAWEAVTEPIVPSGDMNTVTITADQDARFFLLQSAP